MRLTYDDATHTYSLNGRRARSVTVAAKIPDDDYALGQWRKRMVVLGMALSPQLIERAAAHFDDRDQLDQIAEEAMLAAKAHEAAERGTAAHRITERIDLGGPIIDTPLARAVREAWKTALDRAGLEVVPEYVERIVVYPQHWMCGRFDRFLRRRIDGNLVVADLKTGAGAVRYPHAIACQLALYANAPLMAAPLPPSGGTTDQFQPLPADLDRSRGVIIHMPAEDKAEVVEVDIAAGWEAAEKIIFPTLAWRKRQDLIRPLDELLERRRNWLKTRVRALPREAQHRAAALWPPGVPMRAAELDHDDIALVARCLDKVEDEFKLPFAAPDPAAPKAGVKATKPRPTRARTHHTTQHEEAVSD